MITMREPRALWGPAGRTPGCLSTWAWPPLQLRSRVALGKIQGREGSDVCLQKVIADLTAGGRRQAPGEADPQVGGGQSAWQRRGPERREWGVDQDGFEHCLGEHWPRGEMGVGRTTPAFPCWAIRWVLGVFVNEQRNADPRVTPKSVELQQCSNFPSRHLCPRRWWPWGAAGVGTAPGSGEGKRAVPSEW